MYLLPKIIIESANKHLQIVESFKKHKVFLKVPN